MTRLCRNCGSEFGSLDHRVLYCSSSCRTKGQIHARVEYHQKRLAQVRAQSQPVQAHCKVCGRSYERTVDSVRVTCSRRCAVSLRSVYNERGPYRGNSVTVACHRYAEHTGLSIEQALRAWGLA